MTPGPETDPNADGAAQRLLPAALLDLPLAGLPLTDGVRSRLRSKGMLSVADALGTEHKWLTETEAAAVRAALTDALGPALGALAASRVYDGPALRARLLAPFRDADQRLLAAAVGVDEPPQPRQVLVRLAGDSELDDCLQVLRSTLAQRCGDLISRMQVELESGFDKHEGLLTSELLEPGSLLSEICAESEDPQLGLRLAAFCLPNLCHLHRGALCAVTSRGFRELMRTLPLLAPQHLLPLPVTELSAQLRRRNIDAPHGLLTHLLHTELRAVIETDAELGEVAAPDQSTPAARLSELLEEFSGPATLNDLTLAYRQRFRSTSRSRLLRHLSENDAFVRIEQDVWSLRRWHLERLAAVSDLVEQTARRVSTADHRIDLIELLAAEHGPETAWLVLDQLRGDPRVRLLGRGEACGADLKQSSVMRRLQRSFRRAAGDVVKGLFLDNQPASQRRLVRRLLEHNRAFVKTASDRIDTLANYPFNPERMEQLIQLVFAQLNGRAGYAQVEAIKDLVDRAELGGRWLTPSLLADILRRNGPFEVLAPNIVALKDLHLPRALARSARQALRDIGEAVTVDDVLRERPELTGFRDCLAELLVDDPMVQSPDGRYFVLS